MRGDTTDSRRTMARVGAFLLRNSGLWWPAGLTVVFVSALLLMPSLIGMGLKYALREQGVSEVQLDNVDFNPFNGELVLDGLRLGSASQPDLRFARLEARLAWGPLWNRHLQLEQVSLHDASLTVVRNGRGLTIAGIHLPRLRAGSDALAGKPWGIGINQLDIDTTQVNFQDGNFTSMLKLVTLSLGNYASWRPDQSTILSVAGSLDKAVFRAAGQVAEKGGVPEVEAAISLSGLELARYLPYLGKTLDEEQRQTIGRLSGRLDISSRLRLTLATRPVITQEGRLVLRNAKLVNPRVKVHETWLRWKGKIGLKLTDDAPKIHAAGSLKGGAGSLELRTQGMNLRHARLSWRGKLSGSVPNNLSSLAAVSLKGLQLSGPALQHTRGIRLARMTVGRLSTEGTAQVRVKALTVSDMQILTAEARTGQPQRAQFRMKALHIDRIAWQQGDMLVIGKVGLNAITAGLRRDKQGRVLIPALQMPEQTGQSRIPVTIGRIELQGDSRLDFEDRSVTPLFRTTFVPETLMLSELDTADTSKNSPFEIKGSLARYSQVAISGTLCTACTPLTLQLNGQIKALDLPPLSPYVANSIGYQLNNGHLDAGLRLKITQGDIAGNLHLALKQLVVKIVNDKKAEKLQADLGMPLNAALAMLRDKDDNISIKVPISGSLDEPRFSPSDAINQALAKAVKVAALTYLKYTLQPYGVLLTLAELAQEAASHVSLQAIVFKPGEVQPSTNALSYIKKIVQVLKERPGLVLKLRSYAVRHELPLLQGPQSPSVEKQDTRLMELARQRAGAIKAALVKRGIAPSRLFVSESGIDENDGARPRVELAL